MSLLSEEEIENDFDPRGITSMEDHIKLLNYLTEVSKALGKKVIVTAKNEPQSICISVETNDILFNPSSLQSVIVRVRITLAD